MVFGQLIKPQATFKLLEHSLRGDPAQIVIPT